jgi:hypothetical protein
VHKRPLPVASRSLKDVLVSYYGIITSYDSASGEGVIRPNAGGKPLSFRNVDLQHAEAEPCIAEFFAFDTCITDDGRNTAVHLCRL